jgi:hypothetical protein
MASSCVFFIRLKYEYAKILIYKNNYMRNMYAIQGQFRINTLKLFLFKGLNVKQTTFHIEIKTLNTEIEK